MTLVAGEEVKEEEDEEEKDAMERKEKCEWERGEKRYDYETNEV